MTHQLTIRTRSTNEASSWPRMTVRCLGKFWTPLIDFIRTSASAKGSLPCQSSSYHNFNSLHWPWPHWIKLYKRCIKVKSTRKIVNMMSRFEQSFTQHSPMKIKTEHWIFLLVLANRLHYRDITYITRSPVLQNVVGSLNERWTLFVAPIRQSRGPVSSCRRCRM